jgi:ribonuclease Y
MTQNIEIAVIVVLALGVVGTSIYFQQKIKKQQDEFSKKLEEENKLAEKKEQEMASSKAKEIILDAKNRAFEIIKNSEKKELEVKRLITENEKNITHKQEILNQKILSIEQKESSIEETKKKISKLREELASKLEEVSSMSKEEAKKLLLEQIDKELIDEKAKKIKDFEDDIKVRSDEISKEILMDTMEKTVSEYIGSATTSMVDLPNDDIKGKIIGKEGRNIRAFEKITGVDLILDDVPGTITISCFDPLRREVAIVAMKKLIEDKRIHPGKIEEMVKKAREDVSREIRKFGEKVAYDAGINDLRPELISLLGRMKYRYSYGQNVATHSLEMVQIAANLAQSMGANVYLAKKCALFHDIGKVLTAEQEGSHVEIGAEIARKYGLEDEVINAIFAHHDMAEPTCIESAITKIADKISASRPGARNNSAEMYSTRIQKLEDTVKSFPEVEEAYAIYAGREVRVIVKPEVVDDERMKILSYEIAKKVEKENTYPGTVQITLIRETRSVVKAK